MHNGLNVMSVDDDEKLRRANIRLALLLVTAVAGVLVLFVWSVIASGGAA